jgi:hypothetical protein
MTRTRKIALWIVGPVVIALLAVRYVYNMMDIGNQAIQLHLKLIGSAIYEYHTKTGNWPTGPDDLTITSLPPVDVPDIKAGIEVVIWHQDLKADPKENANRILVYHDAGLVSKTGRVWVCWGDLRAEYIRREELEAVLQADGK